MWVVWLKQKHDKCVRVIEREREREREPNVWIEIVGNFPNIERNIGRLIVC